MPLSSAQVSLTINPSFTTRYGNYPITIPAALLNLTTGTASGNANLLYLANRTATTSGDLIDVNGGGLLQPDGTPFNAVEVVGVYVFNNSTTATLTVGGGTNALAGVGFVVKPSGRGMQDTPVDPAFAVTAGSADTIKVACDTGTAAYDVVILGRSA